MASYNPFMIRPLTKCIYCPTLFDPTRGEGDHVLPSGLFGEFEGDRRFRGVCPGCNNELGKNEQRLAQASPLGFFRWVVQPTRRRRNGRGSFEQRGAHGSDGPTFTAQTEHGPMLVRPTRDDPSKCTPVDQIIISEAEDKRHFIPWFPGMNADRVRKEIARRKIGKFDTIRFECDRAHIDEIRLLLQTLFPNWKVTDDYGIEPGTHSIHGRGTFYFETWYYQALAKIAFHYYLCHNKRGLRGDEPAFAATREFIRDGGDKDTFFKPPGPQLIAPFGEVPGGIITSPTWLHLLGGFEVDRTIVVYMQFFVGPDHVSRPHYVTLGVIKSPVVLPARTGLWGHVYEYEDDRTDTKAGKVTEATFSAMNIG